ncbi:MAG: CPBP family intramembrane metalloprotease [Firmicutes bacterium]|nr:CPBP family intramembrane metalloprotease [Bacillota bacterium]
MKINKMRVFEEAKSAKRNYNFILFSILAYALATIAGLLGEIPGLFFINVLPEHIRTVVFSMWMGFGLMIVFTIIHVKFIEKRSIKGLGFYKEKMFGQYIKGALTGMGFMAIVVILGILTGAYTITLNTLTTNGLLSIFLMLCGFVVQGAAEEVLVRGWMLPLLSNRYNVACGLILSSVFFVAFHATNPGITLLPVVNILVCGVFLGLYYIKEQNLWGVFGFHSFWNWSQGNLFGIRVSGNDFPGESIFDTVSNDGMDLISGGVFGSEGGLLTTLVLLAGSFYYLYYLKKHHEF